MTDQERAAADLREVVANEIIHAAQDGLDACGQADAVLSAISAAGKVILDGGINDGLMESQYRAGLMAGWNMGVSNDAERFAAALRYDGHCAAFAAKEPTR